MGTEEAIEICERWFRHIERTKERTVKLQEAARLSRQGERKEAMRIKSEVDSAPVVFDGAALEPAVRHLVAKARQVVE